MQRLKALLILITPLVTMVLLPSGVLAGVGIMARFSDDVVLENLETGKVYNLRTQGHLPYIVTNVGGADVAVSVDIKIPAEEKLKPGYLALVDPNWVQILPNKFQLKPMEQQVCEIIIAVPEEAEYVNKSYQFSIWSHTVGTGFTGSGAEHRLRFSIGKGPQSLAAEKKKKAMMSLEFDVSPLNVYVVGVLPGKSYNVKTEKGISLKLTNKGSTPIKVKPLSVVFPPGINPYHGYEKAPDPSWLTCKPQLVKVGAMSIKEVKLFLNIPDGPAHYGKKYAFLVKAELQGTEVPLEMFSQVLVTVTAGSK
jgi:hypothetical protein